MRALSDVKGGASLIEGGAASPRTLGWTRGDSVRTAVSLVVAVGLLVVAGTLSGSAEPGGGTTAGLSLLYGAALGIVFERGRFCFFCIFRDLLEHKDSRGVYSILTALAVGSIGYAIVFALRLPDPSPGDVGPGAHVGPVSLVLVLAGLAFGLGVVLSGGCIAGHLYRLGEGSLRAIPALLGALVGFAAGFVTWNPLATSFILGAPISWLPSAFGYAPALVLQLVVLIGIGVVLLRWNPPIASRPARRVDASEIRRALFFKRWPVLVSGALVGVIGVVSYLQVGPLGVTSQLSSLTRTSLEGTGFVPETLVGLDASLGGCVALVVATITDNGWSIIGIVAGSLAAALPGRRFRIERPTLRNSATAVVGGVLIGWSAVLGLGCTIGVFLSGVQAFAVSGWVFAASVVAALAIGFRLRLHRL